MYLMSADHSMLSEINFPTLRGLWVVLWQSLTFGMQGVYSGTSGSRWGGYGGGECPPATESSWLRCSHWDGENEDGLHLDWLTRRQGSITQEKDEAGEFSTLGGNLRTI